MGASTEEGVTVMNQKCPKANTCTAPEPFCAESCAAREAPELERMTEPELEQWLWDGAVGRGDVYLHVGNWQKGGVPHHWFDKWRAVNVVSKRSGGSVGAWYALEDDQLVQMGMGANHSSPWPERDAWVKQAYAAHCEAELSAETLRPTAHVATIHEGIDISWKPETKQAQRALFGDDQ
jgi:hypothetical protein